MRGLKIASVAVMGLALSVNSTAAVAATCQPGGAGCVLPLQPPPPPVVNVPPSTVAPPIVEEVAGGGIGSLLPAILGVLALAAILYFVLDEDEAVSV